MTFIIEIDLDKYEYDKSREEQLVQDIQFDLEFEADRCVKFAIEALDKTKGMLKVGWMVQKGDSIYVVEEVTESAATLQNKFVQKDRIRISPYSSLILISDVALQG